MERIPAADYAIIQSMTKKKKTSRLEVIYQPIADLAEYSANARRHPADQINALVASIERFGFVTPILVNSAGEIIGGHARVRAAASCGMTSVPTIRIEHLSEHEVDALRIADNRLAELGEWDAVRLAPEMTKLKESFGDDFPMLEMGFNPSSLAELTEGEFQPPADDADLTLPDNKPKVGPLSTCPACGHSW